MIGIKLKAEDINQNIHNDEVPTKCQANSGTKNVKEGGTVAYRNNNSQGQGVLTNRILSINLKPLCIRKSLL